MLGIVFLLVLLVVGAVGLYLGLKDFRLQDRLVSKIKGVTDYKEEYIYPEKV